MTTSIKCVVLGDGAIGKTCLIEVYHTNDFPAGYAPFYGSTLRNISVDVARRGKNVALEIWDTQGQEDHDRLRPLAYPGTDVFLITFSIINPASFENVQAKWYYEMKRQQQKTPFIIVGLKSDLREDRETIEYLRDKRLRPITYKQGLVLARDLGAVKYMECSSLHSKGVKEIFNLVIDTYFDPYIS